MVEESSLAALPCVNSGNDVFLHRMRDGGHNSVSSLNDTDSSATEWQEENNFTNAECQPGKFPRRRMSSRGSSTHSSTHCSDSMTSFPDLETESKGSEHQKAKALNSCSNGSSFRSNDSQSGRLNESLSNWNSEIKLESSDDEKPTDGMLRLNGPLSRLVALTKSTSEHVLNVTEPKTRRRMSMLACLPSQMTCEQKSFRSCFTETVNDWNSELPVDSDDEGVPLRPLNINGPSCKAKVASTKGVKKSKLPPENVPPVAEGEKPKEGKTSRRSLLSPTMSSRRLMKNLSSESSDSGSRTLASKKKGRKKDESGDSRSGRSSRTSSSSSLKLRGISGRGFMGNGGGEVPPSVTQTADGTLNL